MLTRRRRLPLLVSLIVAFATVMGLGSPDGQDSRDRDARARVTRAAGSHRIEQSDAAVLHDHEPPDPELTPAPELVLAAAAVLAPTSGGDTTVALVSSVLSTVRRPDDGVERPLAAVTTRILTRFGRPAAGRAPPLA